MPVLNVYVPNAVMAELIAQGNKSGKTPQKVASDLIGQSVLGLGGEKRAGD